MVDCKKIMLSQSIESVIPLLKEVIEEGKFVDEFEFKGVGSVEAWCGLYKDKLYGWLPEALERGWVTLNPFDLLALCFAAQADIYTLNWEQ